MVRRQKEERRRTPSRFGSTSGVCGPGMPKDGLVPPPAIVEGAEDEPDDGRGSTIGYMSSDAFSASAREVNLDAIYGGVGSAGAAADALAPTDGGDGDGDESGDGDGGGDRGRRARSNTDNPMHLRSPSSFGSGRTNRAHSHSFSGSAPPPATVELLTALRAAPPKRAAISAAAAALAPSGGDCGETGNEVSSDVSHKDLLS